jgi:hypothetical protein
VTACIYRQIATLAVWPDDRQRFAARVALDRRDATVAVGDLRQVGRC